MSNICFTQYPILLVHGIGFRDRKHPNYWGRIPKLLKQNGADIFYANQDSNGTIESNALQIKTRILEILEETKAIKVNIIAHSKGGLDARYMISALNMQELVASLTTISTPHHGSASVDKLLSLPRFLIKTAAFVSNLWNRILGDKNPDSYKLFHQLTTYHAEEFNKTILNCKEVYYQSYAFVMSGARSDMFLSIPYQFVKWIEGESDGLVTPASAEWGDFKGIVKSASRRGISHCDEVDLRRRNWNKIEQEGFVSDITAFYIKLVSELKVHGL